MIRKLNYIFLALVLAATAKISLAQDDSSSLTLEEVIVTATKRETTELAIPISIETISGEEIFSRNLVNLDDLSAFVPNVDIANGLTHASISIRGIGSGQERSFEQSVSMFIDDVYMPRSRQYRAPFFDMERVEILRGPQAVLFGLNATAGTVNITTASSRPGDEGFVQVTGAYEIEYAGYRGEVIAGGGIGETVGIRVAAQYLDTGDGFYHNTFTGQDENSLEEKVIRASLIWEPNEKLSITAKLNFADALESGDIGEAFGSTAGAITGDEKLDWVRATDPGISRVISDREPGFDHETSSAMVRFDYQAGDYTVTGIASHSEDKFHFTVNTAELPAPAFANYLIEDFAMNSAELRIASPTDQRVTFLGGIYWGKSDLDTDLSTALGPLFFGAPTAIASQYLNELSSETLSAYLHATFNINDNMRFIAGGRYSDLDKDGERFLQDCNFHLYDNDTNPVLQTIPAELIAPAGLQGVCGNPSMRNEIDSGNFMPELAFQWEYSSNSMAYIKYSESVKSGGVSVGAPTPEQMVFDDEIAEGFELGNKSRLMDGRATLSITAFWTEFKDMQLNAFVPDPVTGIPVRIINNAGKATNKGFEADFNIATTNWLTLGASVGYLDSSFDSFDNGPCYPGETPDGTLTGTCDKSGDDTPNAPRWSGNAYADVTYQLNNDLYLIGGVNMGYSDSYFTEGAMDPAALQSSYTRWDARIGIAAADDRWSVLLIGKNLTEEAVNSFSQPLVGYIGYIAAPRTVTLQGTYRF